MFQFLLLLSSNRHANAGLPTTETFHRSLRSRNSGLVGPLTDLASHSLSSVCAGSLGLYISDAPPGLAFLYDPILLESPEATYVVE